MGAAERVDLNAVQAVVNHVRGESPSSALIALDELVLDYLPALVAELRDAREVIGAARALLAEVTIDWHEPRQLARALAAYDRHDPPAGGDQAEGG
jgi:hypothetical protein